VNQRALFITMCETPEGASVAKMREVHGIRKGAVTNFVTRMKGLIYPAQRAGCRLHWFVTAEAAQAWASLPALVPSEWQIASAHLVKAKAPRKSRAKPVMVDLRFGKKPGPVALTSYTAGASKMVSLKADAPVDASGAKFTRCPSGLDHRFVAIPEETPPLFASMGVGRYLEAAA
jgi:hypothetical protein